MFTLRESLSFLLESSASSQLRYRLALQRARRDETGTRLSASYRDVAILQDMDLTVPSSPGRSKELFILGTGPSALELTPENQQRMRTGTTIGLNSWALHDFIPDAYSFEEMENGHYVSVAAGLSSVLARQEVLTSNPLVLHLRSRLETPSNRLVTVPPELNRNARYYGRVNVETRKIDNLDTDLIALLRAQRGGAIAPHVLIDNGMSVARMISLGILRGFGSIVLVGIDLNSSQYFFEEDTSYLSRYGLKSFLPERPITSAHDTELTRGRNFGASQFLPSLARASEAIGGPQVFIGSKSSRLAEHLEEFAWSAPLS